MRASQRVLRFGAAVHWDCLNRKLLAVKGLYPKHSRIKREQLREREGPVSQYNTWKSDIDDSTMFDSQVRSIWLRVLACLAAVVLACGLKN